MIADLSLRKYLSLLAILTLLSSVAIAGFDQVYAARSITLSPTSGPPGTNVTVTGSGFSANASVSIIFDAATVLAEVPANSNGAFSTTVTIPSNASVGSHTIKASDGSAEIPTTTFNVTSPEATITLSPTGGTRGTTVTVSGTNFGASKTITIKFDNNNIATNPTTVTSSSTGSFSATIVIPSTASLGNHSISATDGTESASATFNVVESDITLSPASGATGTVVTVSGTNFAANTSITIKFDNNNITTSPSSVTSTSTGSFSATITIPSTASLGSHTVSASDGTKTASTTFTVIATSITLSPTSGFAGSSVTVAGNGFIAGSGVTIKFGTSTLTTTPSSVVVSSTGTFSATITIPTTVSTGDHTVTATDTSGKTATATFQVLVSGSITLSPTTGNRGASVTLSGSNFSPTSTITIKFDSTTLQTSPSTITTSSTGTFSATITIPITASTGPHTITATDAAGRIGAATFTVASGGVLTLSPTTGLSGTEITVTGSNFTANSRITLKFNEITVATFPSTVVTSSTGGFIAKFDVPAGVGAGSHAVIAEDASGKIGVATFTIEGAGSISLSPASGTVGTAVTVTGSGFPANTAVSIKLNNAAVSTNPSTVTTTSTGSFSATITIPSLALGSHTVSVTVGTKTASATFNVTQTQGASITISPTSASAGTSITVTGSGFAPNKGITINLDGSLVATGTTSSSGTFSALFTLPSVITPGSHTVTANDGSNTASATLSVGGVTGSNVVNVSQMKLVNQLGASVSRPSVGMQVLVQSEVRNTLSTDQEFAYIVQVKNSEGATIMISWMTGTLPAGKQYAVAQSWLVEDEGDYTAEVFVWQSISNPVILAPMQKITFNVR